MNAVLVAQQRGWRRTYFNLTTMPFWAVHVLAFVGVCVLGWSWSGFAMAVGLYFARMFLVTGVYHRYFSHRSYKTSRVVQFLLALACSTTAQKGPLWWAANHRHHHKRSDCDDDLHSPHRGGFWWSQLGWYTSPDFKSTDYDKIKDFARYPELHWFNRYYAWLFLGFGFVLLCIGGMHGMIWGFGISTVMLWHGVSTINSLSHVVGSRRYATSDDSRNNWLLALLTMGEGWHNNHHHYQASCRQGFRWYEIDLTYYILALMSACGLIWDIRTPPRHVVENRPKRVGTR